MLNISIALIKEILSYFVHYLRLETLIPTNFSYIPLGVLFLIGVGLALAGKIVWKILFAMLGAYIGAVFALSLAAYIHFDKIPPLLISLIGAVIGAVLLTFLVRVFLAAGFGYVAYLVIQAFYPLYFFYAVIGAVIAFVAVYLLYNKVIILISGIIGAVIIWYTLFKFGIGDTVAVIIAFVLFTIGLYIQLFRKKQVRKRYIYENQHTL